VDLLSIYSAVDKVGVTRVRVLGPIMRDILLTFLARSELRILLVLRLHVKSTILCECFNSFLITLELKYNADEHSEAW